MKSGRLKVRDLADRFVRECVNVYLKPGTATNDRKHLSDLILPALGERDFESLTRNDVQSLHASLKNTKASVNYARCRSTASRARTSATPTWPTASSTRRSSITAGIIVAATKTTRTLPPAPLYLGGQTTSTTNIASAPAHQSLLAGSSDGVLARFDGAGMWLWGTYFGGAGQEVRVALAATPTAAS